MAFGHTFGKSSKSYNAGKNVWHEVSGKYPIGGTLATASYSKGDVIPAGSMVWLNETTHVATIVKKADSSNLTKVNGLLINDIVIDDIAKGTNGIATCNIAYAGELYIDRIAATDIDEATIKSNLPMIVCLHNA